MISIVIIDDEPLARMLVKEYLQSFSQLQVVAECGDGFEGLKAIQQHKPSLIFLDIQMPKINGFEMLELLDEPPAVIFTTAFDEYAIRAFEANAIDYLLKPYSKERFDKAVEKWLAMLPGTAPALHDALLQSTTLSPAQHDRIVVKQGSNIKIIAVQDVLFFEAADDYVKIHTTEGHFLKNKTLTYFDGLLNKQQFVRVHRSYLLAVKNISRIDPYEKENFVAILRHGQKVPVSKTGYSRLREVLGL
jgi:two-component system LytT family response regulator